MTKEDLVLVLQVLTEAKETREIKKLKEKLSIFIERHNLDENYQKSMQELANRMQKLEPVEENEDNN